MGELVFTKALDVSVVMGAELKQATATEMGFSPWLIRMFLNAPEEDNGERLELDNKKVIGAMVPSDATVVTFFAVVSTNYTGDGLKGTVSYPYAPGEWNWGLSVAPCGTYMIVGNNKYGSGYSYNAGPEAIWRIDFETGAV